MLVIFVFYSSIILFYIFIEFLTNWTISIWIFVSNINNILCVVSIGFLYTSFILLLLLYFYFFYTSTFFILLLLLYFYFFYTSTSLSPIFGFDLLLILHHDIANFAVILLSYFDLDFFVRLETKMGKYFRVQMGLDSEYSTYHYSSKNY